MTKLKLKRYYRVFEDGYYSSIEPCSKHHDGATTFTQAKKELLKLLYSRMDDYRYAISQARKVTKTKVDEANT